MPRRCATGQHETDNRTILNTHMYEHIIMDVRDIGFCVPLPNGMPHGMDCSRAPTLLLLFREVADECAIHVPSLKKFIQVRF